MALHAGLDSEAHVGEPLQTELRKPTRSVFLEATHYMKHYLQFIGSCGPAEFEGNDLPGDNALWQAIGNESVLAGIAGLSGAVDTLALTTEHWSQAPPDKVTPMTAVNWMSVIKRPPCR